MQANHGDAAVARGKQILLFVHLPKAGGTTLNSILDYQLRHNDNVVDEEGFFCSGVYFYPGLGDGGGFFKPPSLAVPEKVVRALRREDLCAVLGHFWFGIHQYIPFETDYITMLRDPAERVVSLYYHIKRFYPQHSEANQKYYRERMVRSADLESMTLEEFIASPPFREADNDQTRRIAGVEPGLGECDETLLETAKKNLQQHFSVAGITERFDESLILMKRHYGWTKKLVYYPANTNPNRPSVHTLSPSLRDTISKKNWLDEQLYQFANGLLDEKIKLEGAEFVDELRELRIRNKELISKSKSNTMP